MKQFNRKAFEAYQEMKEKCNITDTEQEIIDIIEAQEIVSYYTSKGSVSFDYSDVEYV